MQQGHTSYRTYWIAWGVLLVLTLLMILIEGTSLSRVIAVVFLVVAMLAKASLIGGWFMHLKFERAALVLSVVFGTLATAAVLYSLLVPDGLTMLRLAEH